MGGLRAGHAHRAIHGSQSAVQPKLAKDQRVLQLAHRQLPTLGENRRRDGEAHQHGVDGLAHGDVQPEQRRKHGVEQRVAQRGEQDDERKFYGDEHASRIHLMETKMQMKFDHNLDLYQPVYWPSFPLKLKF